MKDNGAEPLTDIDPAVVDQLDDTDPNRVATGSCDATEGQDVAQLAGGFADDTNEQGKGGR